MNTLRVPCLCGLLAVLLRGSAAGAPPKGRITIDRIAAIEYPSQPAWPPAGKTLAFLWDLAGRQNLFAVKPAGPPFALSDFPADSDMLLSDIGEFEWLSSTEVQFLDRYLVHAPVLQSGD